MRSREGVRAWVSRALRGESGAGFVVWRVALWPASVVYAWGAAVSRALRGHAARSLDGVVVLSVGGLTVGGAGKTPCVAWLASLCAADGRRVAVVCRGYRAPLARGAVARATPGDAARCGDEPAELAARLGTTVAVYASRDRWRAAALAREDGAEIVVLDDAFHVYRPAADLRLVLVDAARPWGSGRTLPAGDLRENPRALAEADILVLTRAAGVDTAATRAAVTRVAPTALLVESAHRVVGLVTLDGVPDRNTPPAAVWLLSGVARPADVRRAAEDLGLSVAGATPLADHAVLDDTLLGRVAACAAAAGARVVTTEKDAARLTPAQRAGIARDWRAVRIAFVPTRGEDQLRERIHAAIARRVL